MWHLDFNSTWSEFDFLEDVINIHLNIILLSETKLDDSFVQHNLSWTDMIFNMGFTGTPKVGKLLLYVNEDIPSKFLKIRFNCKIVSICVEINLGKRKWFINGSYNPSQRFIANHLKYLNCIIDECSKSSQNFFVF